MNDLQKVLGLAVLSLVLDLPWLYIQVPAVQDIIKDIQVIPHKWCNMVSSASNFHFANSNNNIKYIEYNIIKNFYKNIFTYKFSYKNNCFDFSLAPGLGVDLTKSKELLKNMSYEKKR